MTLPGESLGFHMTLLMRVPRCPNLYLGNRSERGRLCVVQDGKEVSVAGGTASGPLGTPLKEQLWAFPDRYEPNTNFAFWMELNEYIILTPPPHDGMMIVSNYVDEGWGLPGHWEFVGCPTRVPSLEEVTDEEVAAAKELLN